MFAGFRVKVNESPTTQPQKNFDRGKYAENEVDWELLRVRINRRRMGYLKEQLFLPSAKRGNSADLG